jgi:hypothetical protein
MRKIYCVNELTALPLLLAGLFRRPAWYLAVTPYMQRFRPYLERLVRWGETRGLKRADEIAPSIGPALDYLYRTMLVDFFSRIEDWQSEYYGFRKERVGIERYERCYRHVVSNHLGLMSPIITSLADLADAAGENSVVVGVPADILSAAEAFSGRSLRHFAKPDRNPRFLLNPLLGLGILAASLVWAVIRIRPLGVKRKEYFLAADFVDDASDAMLYHEIAEKGPLLLAGRSKGYSTRRHELDLPPHDFYMLRDGRLDLRQGCRTLAFIFRDGLRILRHFNRLETPVFSVLVALPLYRAIYRAFFTRFGARYFWGRDSYSPYHLIRRQEMERTGGLSWSVCHSYLTYGDRYPEFTYLGFHRYYMLGTYLRDRWYADCWPRDMEIKPSAPFRIPRNVFARRRDEKPNNIMIMASVSLWRPEFHVIARAIAEAFPDRTVFIQVKEVFQSLPVGQRYIEHVTAGLENVVLYSGSPYNLFDKCRYSFSDPSTVSVEPATCGIYAFAIDAEGMRSSVLHEIPGFCVTNAEDAIARIRGIEDGSWRYPVTELAKVIDLSGRTFFDQVRMDFGLPPREEARPAWPELDGTPQEESTTRNSA